MLGDEEESMTPASKKEKFFNSFSDAQFRPLLMQNVPIFLSTTAFAPDGKQKRGSGVGEKRSHALVGALYLLTWDCRSRQLTFYICLRLSFSFSLFYLSVNFRELSFFLRLDDAGDFNRPLKGTHVGWDVGRSTEKISVHCAKKHPADFSADFSSSSSSSRV
jgi:hypothetical protein